MIRRIRFAAVGVALLLSGCQSWRVAAYGATVTACIAQERAIVVRESTREQDERDLAAVRFVCDAALARIESEQP